MQRLSDAAALSPELRAKGTMRSCVTREFIDKNPEIIQQYIEHMIKHPAPPQGGLRQLQAGLRGDSYYERLPEIQLPTLIIHGEADQLIPVENARILASRITNAELFIFKNTGHMLLESQDTIFRVMLDFLYRHRLSSKG
jgi:pimeloyl-ACP methyl ester carboxylesterase